MLHSAWTHHPTAEFYLLDCGIERETLADLSGFASARGIRLTVIKIDLTVFGDMPTTEHWSAAVYARLLIPDLLPRSVERALYLDADCIVVNDLTALWRFDLGEAAIAGVHDAAGASLERKDRKVMEFDDRDYVNSGVMLMNLSIWRRDKLATAVISFATKRNPGFIDQTSINVVCAGKIALLAEQWNFQLHNLLVSEQWLEPCIIHYTSEKKPWLYKDVPFGTIYLYHRNQTPFPIDPPRAALRSDFRRSLNLLIGRRKYREQHMIARRCQAFAKRYFERVKANQSSHQATAQ
jgi:lipopolysaccharide biosynthesis glycosyltransferase